MYVFIIIHVRTCMYSMLRVVKYITWLISLKLTTFPESPENNAVMRLKCIWLESYGHVFVYTKRKMEGLQDYLNERVHVYTPMILTYVHVHVHVYTHQ